MFSTTAAGLGTARRHFSKETDKTSRHGQKHLFTPGTITSKAHAAGVVDTDGGLFSKESDLAKIGVSVPTTACGRWSDDACRSEWVGGSRLLRPSSIRAMTVVGLSRLQT